MLVTHARTTMPEHFNEFVRSSDSPGLTIVGIVLRCLLPRSEHEHGDHARQDFLHRIKSPIGRPGPFGTGTPSQYAIVALTSDSRAGATPDGFATVRSDRIASISSTPSARNK